MDQRVEFVLRARRGEETIAALCREYEISRPTGYLWLHRYQSAGSVKALAEHSRRPLRSPKRTDEKIAAAVRSKPGLNQPTPSAYLNQRPQRDSN